MTSIYQKNIEYLKLLHPDFFSKLLNFNENVENLEFAVEKSKNTRFPHIKIEKPEPSIFLNSRIDPYSEFLRLVESEEKVDEYDLFLISDFFGGLECEALKKKLPDKKVSVCYILFFLKFLLK